MSLLDYAAQDVNKIIFLGESGSGKTAALASLVKAGYKVRIQDYDNGLQILANSLRKEPNANELLSNVSYVTLTDKFKSVAGQIMTEGQPKAFATGMNLLSNWKTEKEDLGPVSSWGPESVLVIDSVTFMAEAAFRWMEAMGVGMGKQGQDMRAVYGEAQKRIGSCLSMLYSDAVKCHVIMNTHIRYTDMPDGSKKGFPTSIGEAFGPKMPRFFNAMLLAKTLPGGRRVISTQSNGLVDLKTPEMPGRIPNELPIETGLADYFRLMKGA